MDVFNKLVNIFEDFPGIGPRQARRFVYFLLNKDDGYRENLAHTLGALKNTVKRCRDCTRIFLDTKPQTLCTTCADSERDQTCLMIVEKEADFEVIERTGVYNGRYFILGGVLPVLADNPETHIRIDGLRELITRKGDTLKEIIVALSATPHGEHTSEYLINTLKDVPLKKTMLARGISTGVELEYIDKDTMKEAFNRRL